MTKIIPLLCLMFALTARAEDAKPETPAPAPAAAPAGPSVSDLTALAGRLEKAITVLTNQRNALGSQLLDAQAVNQVLASENDALKKEVAALKAAAAPKS